jgi:hypothetical protein
VQAPPQRARLAKEKTTHRPARQKLRLHVTPVAAGHAMPEFKSGELRQPSRLPDKKNVLARRPSVCPREISLAHLGAGSGKRASAPHFRARAAAK